MRAVLLPVALLAAIGLAGDAVRTFTSTSARFSVEMPGTPMAVASKPHRMVKDQASYVLKTTGGVFMVNKATIGTKIPAGQGGQWALGKVAEGVRGKMRVLKETAVSGAKWPTRDLRLAGPDGTYTMARLMLVRQDLYMLLWMGPEHLKSNAVVLRFFRSFKLL